MSRERIKVIEFGPIVPWGNPVYLAQVFERNCFKRWMTIGVGSSQERAQRVAC